MSCTGVIRRRGALRLVDELERLLGRGNGCGSSPSRCRPARRCTGSCAGALRQGSMSPARTAYLVSSVRSRMRSFWRMLAR